MNQKCYCNEVIRGLADWCDMHGEDIESLLGNKINENKTVTEEIPTNK